MSELDHSKVICEFCYKELPAGAHAEAHGWNLVFQSFVCPECFRRVSVDGGFAVVKGGAYASRPDPRLKFRYIVRNKRGEILYNCSFGLCFKSQQLADSVAENANELHSGDGWTSEACKDFDCRQCAGSE